MATVNFDPQMVTVLVGSAFVVVWLVSHEQLQLASLCFGNVFVMSVQVNLLIRGKAFVNQTDADGALPVQAGVEVGRCDGHRALERRIWLN